MGTRKRIILELTPAAIDGAVIRCGRVLRSSHVELQPADWRQAWEEGLSPFDNKLNALIAALDAHSASIDIAYRSPTSFAEVITTPVTGSAVNSAAKLALADHVGFDLQSNPYCIDPIATATINGVRATHALTVADDSAVSETLCAWLDRAGSQLVSACPGSALSLGDAVGEACEDRAVSVSVRLFFDRYCSVLTVASGGSVRLIRRIEIGFEDIVTAMARPIIRREAEGESVSLTPSQARTILCVLGIPGFKSTVDEALGLTGKDVLPLIQPALQRLAIEIKQSLRFELSTQEREAIMLTFSGPFGAMPNLAAAICEQIEIRQDHSGAESLDRSTVEAPFMGDPNRASRLAQLTRSHSLVSRRITSEQRVDSFRVGLRIGAAAAALTLAATAFITHSQIQNQHRFARNLGVAVEMVDQIIEINEAIQIRSDTLVATQARMGEAIGMTTRWSDALAVLPGLIPDAVELTDIEGVERTEQAPPRFELTGIARNDNQRNSQAALNAFIESLKACPLVASVDLGATNRLDDASASESMRFSVVVNLVSTPRLAVVRVDEGEAP